MIVYWDDKVEGAHLLFLSNILLNIHLLTYTSHILSTQWQHVATSNCVQKQNDSSLQKILLDSSER